MVLLLGVAMVGMLCKCVARCCIGCYSVAC